ncbi:DNA primase large subunit-like [Topomyia yanbarensis]|uniref:DNA primase large subunit-like n=1 Tax=Topomyia yanbarensis TaxID=2498891 RepID=UPI00273C6D0E|nr:DNA primase large subunit-like [Topomyia yanbarensis]XP_058824284.1 DNA primase large subunit-like [Topomyia yanbarensis]
MEFSRRSRLRPETQFNLDSVLEWLIPHNVALYVIPPMVDLTISEFESLALERLKVLRVLEQTAAKNLKPMSDEWREAIFNELNNDGLKHYVRLCQGNHSKEQDIAARRKDYLSHFILRFVYCRSEELRRWFISREMELFRLKFGGLSAQDVKDFIQKYEMSYTPLTPEQKNEIKDGLYESTVYQSIVQIEAMDFYQVRFTDVLDLVRGRKCYLKGGFAYVCANDFISIIANKHLQLLEDGLQAHLRLLPELENDERFSVMLKGLHTSYTGKDYTISKAGAVPIESLDQLSKKSYPLCMRYCHDTLRAKHHLKYGGRLQYGLFLKGIGVTMEDSLRFWREELTRGTIPIEKFEKEYAYGIRFNYGKEGSRINYSPYSCMKIITASVGPQETHGCPFKIWDSSTVKTKLTSYGLSVAHAEEIVSYVSKGHYQIACGKYHEAVHQNKLDEGILHPNQYFELSQITMGARAPKAKPSAGSNRRTFNSQDSSQIGRSQDTTTLNADDDGELWQLMESKEKDSNESEKPGSLLLIKESKTQTKSQRPAEAANEWGDDDDFDVSLVDME